MKGEEKERIFKERRNKEYGRRGEKRIWKKRRNKEYGMREEIKNMEGEEK